MKDLIIYFAGGTMKGVFSAGIATAFEKQNLYPRIKAIYAASAGAMTGAYFLAHQTEIGSSIYWENLTKNFISIKDFYIGVWQRFKNRFIKTVPPNTLKDALNIDYIMDIVENKKKLDIQTIISQDIPLFVKFFNLKTHTIEYIDARRPDIIDILRVGISIFPYIHNLKKIDGNSYIDAGTIEVLGINYLINKYPEDKIIVVLNREINNKLSYQIKNILEGKFMQWMFDDPELYQIYASVESRLYKDASIIKEGENIILTTPPSNIPIRSRTTSANILLNTYQAGIKEGDEIIKKVIG